MRIRKNAKVSPLLYSGYALKNESLLQTHVCQLNQSPWDVIVFPPPSPSPSPLLPPSSNQVGGDDSFMGNGSLGDSIGPVESVASMKNSFHGDEDMKEDADLKWSLSFERLAMANKAAEFQDRFMNDDSNDPRGKGGWQSGMKLPGTNGQSSGECRSPTAFGGCGDPNPKRIDKPPETKRRPRPRKARPSSNPYEFYYYSGFGPLWGKRRGPSRAEYGHDRAIGDEVMNNLEMYEPMIDAAAAAAASGCAVAMATTSSSSSQFEDDEFDYVEDYEDEERRKSKKRGRKPIKARSLKSLM